MKKLRTD